MSSGTAIVAGKAIRCPGCKLLLIVPADVQASTGYCRLCGTVLELDQPDRFVISDDAIAGWLGQGRQREADPTEVGPSVALNQAPPAQSPSPAQAAPGLSEAPASERPAGVIRLVKQEGGRVTFEFPADRLREADFRLALPRRCLRCGAQGRMRVHLVHFQPAVPMEGAPARLPEDFFDVDTVSQLDGAELLGRLARVAGLPSPVDLPMPYYTCSRCEPGGLAAGRFHVHASHAVCRLELSNLPLAAEFLTRAGGSGEQCRRLAEQIEKLEQDPWRRLPIEVRNRVAGWFRLGRDERFLGFVPDVRLARTEVGMAGLVVSTSRLVYHRPGRHRQFELGELATVHVSVQAELHTVHLSLPRLHKAISIATDRAGMKNLRRSLDRAGAKVTWA